MENLAHSASLDSELKDAPSKPGIKHLGVLLFLVATGLTLIFGVLDFVNSSHGSLHTGGLFALTFQTLTDSFFLAAVFAGQSSV
ncbi:MULTISPECIES: hypothetical protein [unclassified Mesorhizobium]|uniref:hypothetical protein n=1 Tax=unclassified Mesorhizobium TaxID=325217 RepID=UPI0012DD95DF|nr:hypothetical protein [Mesorhizobium sp. L2C066B000]